ncbi:MAG: hypothetical protein D6732_00905 [Methanobacteriota archaeon]|nr:MAG: hypothetical protein D6732_00905 [Euryarchaeota archaeon]
MALPSWYQLQEVSGNQIEIEDGFRMIVQRINQLTQLKVMKRNELSNIFEERLIQEEEEKEELLGHMMLRIATVLDLRLTSWLLESEGDMFAFRFAQEKWNRKLEILRHLFGEENVLEIPEVALRIDDPYIHDLLNRGRNVLHSYFGVHFTQAPFLLRKRIGRLIKGWVIIDMKSAIPFVKREFEYRLRKEMDSLRERMETRPNLKRQAMIFYEYIQKDVFEKIMQPRRETVNLDIISLDGDLESNYLKLPPCIQDLLHRVDREGYIGHWERFQLGIFLKQIGMPVEEQLQFWYSKAVDNIGISFEQFQKKAGYIIRHIYGLEGGKIDYNMPSCSTIQDRMFCTFKHANLDSIRSKVISLAEAIDAENPEPLADLVAEKARMGDYGLACGYVLNLMTKRKDFPKRIQHPMIYLKMTSEFNKKMKEQTKTKE